ncbi:hypothetical protein G6F22_014862 [Rhizopus arrhizus]|nr:hypothetical protein G6F22_014862 [Rhizopus arrhizus]
MPLPFKLESALLDSNLQVVFEQPKDAAPKIRVVGDLGLRRFDLRDTAGEGLAAWSALTVTRLELEPIARQVYVGEVGLWAPQIHVRRYANQHLNWQDVVAKLKELGGVAPNETPVADKLKRDVGLKVAPKTEVAKVDAPKPDPAKPGAATSDPAKPDTATTGAPAAPAASGTDTAAPPPPAAPEEWKVTLDAFNLHEGELYITDAISKLDYVMTGMAVTVEGVAIPEVQDQPVNLGRWS